MMWNLLSRRTLKTKMTALTVAVFVAGIWLLTFFASWVLRAEMTKELGAQQQATTTIVAAHLNQELADRLHALELVAERLGSLQGDAAGMQTTLGELLVLQTLFNGGLFVAGPEGTAVADVPRSAGRIGTNYMDRTTVSVPLREGRSIIGKPAMGKKLLAPIFSLAAPIRDRQGRITGVLVGTVNLGLPSFLDDLVQNAYGRAGGFLLVAPEHGMIVTATDRRRIMAPLDTTGVNAMHVHFAEGRDGYRVAANERGEEVLVAASVMPASGWLLATELSAEEAFAPITAMQRNIFAASILLTLLAGFLVWRITSGVLRRNLAPIHATAKHLVAGAKSDSVPPPLPVNTHGEIGELIGSFNRLLQTLTNREEDLKVSELLFRSLVEGAPFGIVVGRASGAFEYVNTTVTEMIGYSMDEVPDVATWWQTVAPEPADRRRMMDTWQRAVVEQIGSGRVDCIFTVRCRDGGLRDIRFLAAPLNDGRMLICLQDMTEFNLAADRVRKLSLAVEQSTSSVVITNVAGEIEYVNDAFVANTGYERAEVIGRNPRLLQSGRTPPETYSALWAALVDGRSWKGIFHNRRKDGVEIVEAAIVTPLRQENGRISHYVAVKNDITERVRIEQELDTHRNHLEQLVEARTHELDIARQEAEQANTSKSAFLANMSHEIRTPMNGILGMANILRREGVSSMQAKRLDTIEGCAGHLLSIINDILDISKIEAGKLVLESTPVNVGQLLDEVRGILAPRAAGKGLQLHVEVGPMPGHLQGDATRLRQGLLNFATNAIKFTDTGSVALQAEVVEEDAGSALVRFEVTDTGIGIAPEAMERLFASFEQADRSTTRKYGGTGLGLVITRRLAEMMGGVAGAKSVSGVGSVFWFTARLCIGQGAVVDDSSVPLEGAEEILKRDHAGVRILLAEDEPVNQEIARLLLGEVGVVLDVASDGIEALSMAEANDYALILMDMQMPNLDGLTATQEIRRLDKCRSTPIVAMTANAFADDRERCFAAGMNDFVSKPVDPDVLFATVLRWVSKS
jgi:PAS domain S-box-containing protein